MTRKLWKRAENVDLRAHEDPDLPHTPPGPSAFVAWLRGTRTRPGAREERE